MFTSDPIFNFELKRIMMVWVQLIPDAAILWYVFSATRLPADIAKRTSHTLTLMSGTGIYKETANAVEGK
jgi:hypothetical protein|tara:strand:- start:617 stop:826 length:210 start_codon:yes stop_codon:yes gene_type:complete